MEGRHGTEDEEGHRDGGGSELGPSLRVCVHVDLSAQVAFLDAGQREGRPAAGMEVEPWRSSGSPRELGAGA
jgi:hypothetical protein